YARKSTDEADRQVLSIESQLLEVREYAEKEGLTIVKEFIETKSAKSPGREVFEKMLSGIENGEANGIISWHPDRLARNAVDAGKIIHLLDLGKLDTLKFPTFWFEKTPQGLFMLSIAFGQSKYYIDNLSENIKRGIRQKLRKGIYPARAPIGYLNELRNHTIIKDPEKWVIIKKLFIAYATNEYTLENIQKLAFSWGLKSRTNNKLPLSVIVRILANPFYYGVFQYQGELYEGIHGPIIERRLFEKVNEIMESRAKSRKTKQDYNFIFTGIFKCAECGRAITAEQHIKKSGLVFRYYRCTKKQTACQQKYLNENNLISQINNIFQKVALPKKWFKPIMDRLNKEENKINQNSKSQIQNLQKEIGEIETKLSKLLDMQLNNTISVDEYKQKKEQLLNQKIDLKQKLSDLERKGNYWLEPMRNFILAAFQANKLRLSQNLAEKRSFLQKIGSNWQLGGQKINYKPKNEWQIAARSQSFSEWSG
ncbi:MAG: recombinase family protein, partial [Candidatus Berkelbacteria bacterium]|nr:recombinase family protein [Candidatus Berkelbacteria bacterium]